MRRARTIRTGALAAGLLVGPLLAGAMSPTWAATTTTTTSSSTSSTVCYGTAARLTASPSSIAAGGRLSVSARVLMSHTAEDTTCGSPYSGPVTLVLTVGSHAESQPPEATVVLAVPDADNGVVVGDPVVPADTPPGPGILTLSWPNGAIGGSPVSIPVTVEAAVALPPAPPAAGEPAFTG
jgi:hypothetical protein